MCQKFAFGHVSIDCTQTHTQHLPASTKNNRRFAISNIYIHLILTHTYVEGFHMKFEFKRNFYTHTAKHTRCPIVLQADNTVCTIGCFISVTPQRSYGRDRMILLVFLK